MSNEIAKSEDSVSAALITNPSMEEIVGASGTYFVECIGADGQVKWTDTFKNLVVNVGLQNMVQTYLAGTGYTAAWDWGLITGPGSGNTYAAGDTLASHAGWTENTAYTGNRKAATFGTATTANPSVISNSASPASFAMTGTATIAGAFLCSAASGTSGTLFSEKNFTGGDKTVANGDTLNVTYQFSLTAT